MKRQPLRNLRKTTVLVIAVFLGFFIHRIIAFCMDDETVREDSTKVELIEAQGVVCSYVVNGSPYGVDSSFDANSKLYFYSTVARSSISEEDTLYHVWFNGLDTIQKAPCRLTGESCFTFVDPKMATEGEWSVDFVKGRKLLATKQFKVVAPVR